VWKLEKLVNTRLVPTFDEEKLLEAQGYRLVAGVDETGRGALAGPVVAAAVILPCGIEEVWLEWVRDSKVLVRARRELLLEHISRAAVSLAFAMVDNQTIDSRGIATATRLAMKEAVEKLLPEPQHLLIDYFRLPEVALPQKGVLDGDALCYSIACASIVAKVARDRLMVQLDSLYPGYGFAHHKGYGTREHLDCLQKLGPSPVHRRSFRPVNGGLPGLE
jgi:ribonuclease HII